MAAHCTHHKSEVVYVDETPVELQCLEVCCKCDKVIHEGHPTECTKEY